MPIISVIRERLSLKVALALAGATLVLTSLAAFIIIGRQTRDLEELTLTKARSSARIGALAYGRVLEDGIDNNYVSVQDVFDQNYQLIKGYDWGGKPKFHTKYDFYTDRVVVQLQDRFIENDDVISAIGTDSNGYLPTHNSKYSRPLTGDVAKDTFGNRGKRILDYDVAKVAAKSLAPSLVQNYVRDTGERAWDVSSPIYVKGKHWGAFRLVVAVSEVEKRRNALILNLLIMFGVFSVATSALIFAMLQRAMKPLVALTALADELSMGEGLENPIKPATVDEVGRMAKSVDRLRASLKAAMARLGE